MYTLNLEIYYYLNTSAWHPSCTTETCVHCPKSMFPVILAYTQTTVLTVVWGLGKEHIAAIGR